MHHQLKPPHMNESKHVKNRLRGGVLGEDIPPMQNELVTSARSHFVV